MAEAELFKTAPAEVIRYFRAKRSIPSFDWRDVAPEEHAYSFTVAKTMERDVLEDLRAAVDDAIVNRTPFDQFQGRLEPILRAKGWWGRALQEDPKDGVPKVVQLGSPRRLRTIYWANTATAHAAGEWERTERNKRFLPYLLYTLSRAERRRPEHESWVGFIAPVDDPVWDRIYPPNGWGCQCGVRQISRREALALGYRDDQPPLQLVMRSWRNRRTGQTVEVPAGVDPGWDTNPGKNRGRNVSEFLTGRVDALPAHRQSAAIADIVGSPAMAALAAGRMPTGFSLPVAQVPPAAVGALGARHATVHLSSSSAAHILHEHAERGLSVEDFRAAASIIARPAAIVPRGRALVLVGVAAEQWWRVVVKSANDGREWWLSSLHRKSEEEALKFIGRERRKNNVID